MILAAGIGVVPLSTPPLAGPSRPPARALKSSKLAADKARVPKPPPEPKPRTKGTTETARDEEDEDSDCFSDCLFSSLFGSHNEPEPRVETALVAAPPPGWRIGDLAVVPDGVPDGVLTLWSAAGGEAEGHEFVGELPAGTSIRVLEIHTMASGEWLRVAREDGAGKAGWVPASAIARPPGPPPPPPRWPVERPAGASPRAIFLASAGPAFLVGPTEVREEYVNPLGRIGVGVGWRIAPRLCVGLAGGWGYATGQPKFDYVTFTGIDMPQSSTLNVTDVGLRAGDVVPLGSGKTQWFWGLGPGAYWVHESAEILHQDTTSVTVRTESLSRVTIGGEVVTGFLWWTGNRGGNDYLGFQIRGFAFAWTSDQVKSLTFDWIGDQTPVGVEIAFVYAHDWF